MFKKGVCMGQSYEWGRTPASPNPLRTTLQVLPGCPRDSRRYAATTHTIFGLGPIVITLFMYMFKMKREIQQCPQTHGNFDTLPPLLPPIPWLTYPGPIDV